MDNAEAIKSLYRIVAKQQEAIKKLAQAHGVPMPAPHPAPASDLTAKLRATLFGAHPGMEAAFVEAPSVAPSAAGKSVVKYKALHNDERVAHAVSGAADSVLGAGQYTLAPATTF